MTPRPPRAERLHPALLVRATLLSLFVIGLTWCLGCSKPVPIRVEAEKSPAPQRLSCPPCDCPACESCPVCPEPAPAAEGSATDDPPTLPIPDHLRPSELQCKRACGRLMDVEVRRMMARMEKAEPGLQKALNKGLNKEKDELSAACVKRCEQEFTVTTTACIVKFEDLDAINKCILKMTLE